VAGIVKISGKETIMCLTLTEKSSEQTKRLRNRKKPFKAYKVLALPQNGDSCVGHSPVYKLPWHFGHNESNRSSTDLTAKEIRDRRIDYGIHLHTSRRVAKIHRRIADEYAAKPVVIGYRRNAKHEIFEVEVNPQDIVAVGTVRGVNTPYRTLVATRVNLPKKEAVCA